MQDFISIFEKYLDYVDFITWGNILIILAVKEFKVRPYNLLLHIQNFE